MNQNKAVSNKSITLPSLQYITFTLTKVETQGLRVVAHSLLLKVGTLGEGDTTIQTHRNIERKPELSRYHSR